MSNSVQTVVSDGSLTLLDISFNYFDRTHVHVYFDNVEQTLGTTWSWVGTTDKKIQFSPAVADDVVVKVQRITPLESPRHVYSSPGNAPFNKSTVDENFRQTLYAAQEAQEGANLTQLQQDLDAQGNKITDLGDALLDNDAVNLKVLREYLPYGPAAASLNSRIAAEEAQTAALAGQYGSALVGAATYAQLRAYTGDATRIQLGGRNNYFDNCGGIVVRTGSQPDNDGTTWKDGLGRSWVRQFDGKADIRWFGAPCDGISDDTAGWQAAVSALQGKGLELVVPGFSVISGQVSITSGLLTIRWLNKGTSLKKRFNGEAFRVMAGYVDFINPAINGCADEGFTGGAIRFAGTSYDCTIVNPRIWNTGDSCVICDNGVSGTGGGGLIINGGSLLAYNPSGQSSGGPASVRLHGASDTSPQNRKLIGVTSSSQPLLDATGMFQTAVIGGFTGTIIFSGNPNVTGATGVGSCSELQLDSVYIRDGMSIAGTDHVINGCITHGYYPIYYSYGVVSGYSSQWGWQLTQYAQNVSIGQGNEISHLIQDLSPNGLGLVCNKYFQNYVPFGFLWTGASANPAIGNGSFTAQTYNVTGANIAISYGITFGSTTTLGTGQWYFSLPLWSGNAATSPAVGAWSMFIPGVGWKSGFVYISSTGATHRVSLVDTAGVTVGSTYNGGTLPSGTTLTINLNYQRL